MVGGILLPAIENERLAQWRNLESQMKENFRDDPNWQPVGYLEKLVSILDTTNVILVIKLKKIRSMSSLHLQFTLMDKRI